VPASGGSWLGGRRGAAVVSGAAVAVLLAACSASTHPSALPTKATGTTAPATPSRTSSPATSVTRTTAVTRPTIPLETGTAGEFYAPGKNISCEIDDSASLHQVYCETISPPQSVTMALDGTLTPCTGEQCLSNAGLHTPTLPYGTATGTGPFRCLSTPQGMRCTIRSGGGFAIAASGITTIDG
jgi:hypothetical protein